MSTQRSVTQKSIADNGRRHIAIVSDGAHRALAPLDRARRILAEATSVDVLKTLRDQAEALRLYTKQRNMSRESPNYCAEIKLRAERRIGGILQNSPASGSGRRPKKSDDTTFLPDGISRDQSSDWQRLAAVPEDVFNTYIVETKAKPDGEITTAAALKLAPRSTKRFRLNAAGRHEGLVVSDKDASGENWAPLLGDFRKRLLELPNGSISLIATDPPYPKEYLPLWGALGEQASRLLRPGGIMATRRGRPCTRGANTKRLGCRRPA